MRETIHVDGADEARRKLKTFDKAANAAMRKAARGIVDELAPRIKAAAGRSSRQGRLVADSIRTRSDRFPSIVAGGSKRLNPSGARSGKRRPAAGDVFFGAEFGGSRRPTTRQFGEWTGKEGRFFWPEIRANESEIGRRWLDAVDEVAKELE